MIILNETHPNNPIVKNNMQRRNFLQQTALIPLCAATSATVIGSLNPLFGRQSPVTRFHAPTPMMVGLNAYSFAKELIAGTQGGAGMTLDQLLDYCVDPAHRFDAVDITGYYFPNYSATEATVPPDRFVENLKRRAADLGLAISGTGIGNSLTGVPVDRQGKEGKAFSTDEGGHRAAIENDIKRIKAWVEVAARLGASVLRVFIGLEPSYLMKENISPNDPLKEDKARKLTAWRASATKSMVDDLSQVVEYGKRFGVIIGIQNHGDFLKTAEDTIELLKAVNSDWIGLVVDTGYFVTQDCYVDIEKVMPYGVNFQIKEYVRTSSSPYSKPKLQPIDLDRLMGIIRRSGYQGYLPIETLSVGKSAYDPYNDVPPFLESVRQSIKKLV